jgi:hypothetical protein
VTEYVRFSKRTTAWSGGADRPIEVENMVRKGWILVTVLLTALVTVGGTPQAAENLVEVEVPFEFVVEGEALPAGSYTVVVDGANGNDVVLQNGRTGDLTKLTVLTRLADVGRNRSYLVFDTVGDGRFLSEIHSPGMDGYALPGAGQEHGHQSLSGGN